MKLSISFTRIIKSIGRFFSRFHTTIFIVILVGILAYIVVSLYDLLIEASFVPETTATSNSTTFDQTTIDRLKTLHKSDAAPSSIELPSGRINPFSE